MLLVQVCSCIRFLFKRRKSWLAIDVQLLPNIQNNVRYSLDEARHYWTINLEIPFGFDISSVSGNTEPKDQQLIPVQVFYLLIVETINTAFDMHIIYQPLVLRSGRFSFS